MKKILLTVLTCLSILPSNAASQGMIRGYISDFPAINPTDAFELFGSDIAGSSAGTAGPLILTEGGQVYYFAGGSVPRFQIGGRNPLTTLDIRGTPVSNFGLGYFNDQHTWTGSSGTGPELYGAVGLQSVFRIGMTDNIVADNSYNVDVSAIGGVINTFQHRNLRLSSVDSAGGLLPQIVLSHAGFVAFPYGLIQGTDTNLVFQGDTNALGVGGLIGFEPAPTKYINLGGGIKHNWLTGGSAHPIATNEYFFIATSSVNVTNMDASDVGSGRVIWIGAESGDTATIIPQPGDTINGGASLAVTSDVVGLVSDGISNWTAFARYNSGAVASAYATIQEEGTPLTQRTTLNFVGSSGTAADTGAITELTFDTDLNALASAAGTGVYVRTGAGTSAQRSNTSTGGTVLITNPDGVAGNPNFEVNPNSTAVFTKTISNSATNHIFTVTLASGGMSGLIVDGTISATDTVDFQSYTSSWSVSVVNKGGTFSPDVNDGNLTLAVSSGAGMTPIVTFDDNGSNAYVFVLDPDSGLTTTSIIFRYTIKNLTGNTIVIH